MIGKTTQPREPIVKLLAVLIDFRPRPYDKWVKERDDNAEKNGEEKVEEEPLNDNPKQSQTGNTAQKEDSGHKAEMISKMPKETSVWSSLKKSALYGIIAFAGMAGAYQIADSLDRECMYWKTDRYIPIECSEKIDGVEIIPLDKRTVSDFRKIMRQDTLTLASVGKVWYGKPTADSAEFYTTKGVYPLDKEKELKPATEYIIKKYVLDKYK